MKRTLICLTLSAAMMLSGSVMAFAAEGETEAEETPVRVIEPTMNFTGQVINLSLDQAVTKMQTEGVRAETADLNRQTDLAIASGYADADKSLVQMINKYGDYGVSIDSGGEQKVVKIRKEYAQLHMESNAQAEMNKIESDTVGLYYGVLLAQDQLKAAEDNLQIQKDILANTSKKFDLGTVAKIDVLTAENGVVNAEKAVLEAKNALTEAKMSFNMLLGYPLMQNVNFTDTLKEIEAPKVSLQTAVSNAMENRLEVKEADLGVEVNEILLSNKAVTVNRASASYKSQQVQLLAAQTYQKNVPTIIEQDVRNKYLDMETKRTVMETSKTNLELAQEAYRIASISYDAGMNTLIDVQQAQYTVFQANQAVSYATFEYDMAVYAYNYAQTVGTERITL